MSHRWRSINMPHSAQFCPSSSGPLICKWFLGYCVFGVTTDIMPNNLPDTSRTEEGNSQPLSNFLKSQQCFMLAKAVILTVFQSIAKITVTTTMLLCIKFQKLKLPGVPRQWACRERMGLLWFNILKKFQQSWSYPLADSADCLPIDFASLISTSAVYSSTKFEPLEAPLFLQNELAVMLSLLSVLPWPTANTQLQKNSCLCP